MAYIVDPINNTLIDDEKPFTKIADNLGKKKEYKQLEFDFSEKKKDVPVRKPGAVPPKTFLFALCSCNQFIKITGSHTCYGS